MCQRNKHSTQALYTSKGRIVRTITTFIFFYKNISMDFITSLPKYSEANVILIIFDKFTKTTRFVVMAMFRRNSKDKL